MSDVEFMSESWERFAPLPSSESLSRGAQHCGADHECHGAARLRPRSAADTLKKEFLGICWRSSRRPLSAPQLLHSAPTDSPAHRLPAPLRASSISEV